MSMNRIIMDLCAPSYSSSVFSGFFLGSGSYKAKFKVWCIFYLTMLFESSISVSIPSAVPTCIQNSISDCVRNSSTITIGFLCSFTYVNGPCKLTAGAMSAAVEDVNANNSLLPRHRLEFKIGNSVQPQTAHAIRKMTEMRDEGVIAFIGPDHSCGSEALVAAAWNLPMITFDCRDQKVSDKKIYPTFARTLTTSDKASKSVVALLEYYSWKKIVLIVSNKTSDLQAEETLRLLALNHSIQILQRYDLPEDYYLKEDKQYIINIIEKSYERARIYVLLANDYAMIDFAREMHKRKLSRNGEYAIILVEGEYLYDEKKPLQFMQKVHEASLYSRVDTDPFRCVLVITPVIKDYENFTERVRNYTAKPPFHVPYLEGIKVNVPKTAAFLYDAVMVYAHAVTELLEEGIPPENGTAVFQRIKHRSYESVLGFSVMIDDNGDAEGNFSLLALIDSANGKGKSIRPVGAFISRGPTTPQSLNLTEPNIIKWIGGAPPKDEPDCGFLNEKCKRSPDIQLVLICTSCAIILIVAAFFALRHFSYEHKLTRLLWKVDMKDVVLIKANANTPVQNGKVVKNIQGFERSRFNNFKERNGVDLATGRLLNKLGFYKGNAVYIKPVYKKNVDLNRALRMEMIQIREMRQENINPFIGACVDHPNICIMTLFCTRGSLMDILKNEDINLDSVFIASLVADLIKGMCYIHESEIGFHGNLKSTNCLVDSRWVLQITDFGLHEFKSGQDLPAEERVKCFEGFLWRAPELLRSLNPTAPGTQKGDAYSFGIILHEILARQGPWGYSPIRPEIIEEIVDKVMNPQTHDGKLYRPSTQGLQCPNFVIRCMEDCWNENPEFRHDFRFIGSMLRDMLHEVKTNIFDNMIAIMEKYASNLEELVQERTHLLMEEKKKTENLLLRMLPKSVAEQLKKGQKVEAESFDCVTIYFSDIVGFTALSAVSTPLQVVDLLNDLYTCFDSIIGNYDVYKVETIGDAYMVVSGLPIRNNDNHAVQIVSMALHLLCAIKSFEIPHKPGERLKLRIGIHSGPCVAGVVGLKMPRYCLFGDTVNTASRMESTGEALKIHVSSACKDILDKVGDFELEERGLTQVKGKGEMRTYWLLGRIAEAGQSLGYAVNTEYSSQDLTPNSVFGENQLKEQTNFLHETTDLPHSELSHLLSNGHVNKIATNGRYARATSCKGTYKSCLNLYNEYKIAFRGFTKDSGSLNLGYRSTPIISLNGLSSRHGSLKLPHTAKMA